MAVGQTMNTSHHLYICCGVDFTFHDWWHLLIGGGKWTCGPVSENRTWSFLLKTNNAKAFDKCLICVICFREAESELNSTKDQLLMYRDSVSTKDETIMTLTNKIFDYECNSGQTSEQQSLAALNLIEIEKLKVSRGNRFFAQTRFKCSILGCQFPKIYLSFSSWFPEQKSGKYTLYFRPLWMPTRCRTSFWTRKFWSWLSWDRMMKPEKNSFSCENHCWRTWIWCYFLNLRCSRINCALPHKGLCKNMNKIKGFLSERFQKKHRSRSEVLSDSEQIPVVFGSTQSSAKRWATPVNNQLVSFASLWVHFAVFLWNWT